MSQGLLFPAAVTFDRVEDDLCDRLLCDWGHYLEACERPFGRHSWGLAINGELVSVAVSASTVNRRCAGLDRYEVVELARLCSAPTDRDMTRVCLRLWRRLAPLAWSGQYWPVKSLVSYSDSTRHAGDVYRFDGWTLWGETKPGRAGKSSTWSEPGKEIPPKRVWTFELGEAS